MGLTYAKAISFATGMPLIAVNHIEGHIHAVILEARLRGTPVELPALALIVSGGHTHLFEVAPRAATGCSGAPATMPRAKLSTKSPSCWASAIRAARWSTGWRLTAIPRAVRFTLAKMKGNALDFSFSGLKTAVLRWVESRDMAAEIAAAHDLLRRDPGPTHEEWLAVTPRATLDLLASFQHTVVEELLRRALAAADQVRACAR